MWCMTFLPVGGAFGNSPRVFTIPWSMDKYCWKTGGTLEHCLDGCSGTPSARHRKPSARSPLLWARGRANMGASPVQGNPWECSDALCCPTSRSEHPILGMGCRCVAPPRLSTCLARRRAILIFRSSLPRSLAPAGGAITGTCQLVSHAYNTVCWTSYNRMARRSAVTRTHANPCVACPKRCRGSPPRTGGQFRSTRPFDDLLVKADIAVGLVMVMQDMTICSAETLAEVLGPPPVGDGRADAMSQAPYHFTKSCFDVVIADVVRLCTCTCLWAVPPQLGAYAYTK